MKKTFCDRCGGEVDMAKRPSLGVARFMYSMYSEDSYTMMDLCEPCTLSLAQWVKL